jgi:drug/metabolite transporter (DMT)-like permease
MKRTEAGGHRLGVALVTLSAVIWSTAGFFTRLIATDTWTLLFWRSVFGAVFLLAALVWQERSGVLRAIGAMGWPGWAVALLSAGIILTYLSALRLTAVADVMIIQATLPFMVAGLAWLAMRERASRSTILASALAAIGVVVMLGGAPLAGNPWGVILAFVTTGLYAGVIVLLRWHREVPMTAAALLAALLGSAVTLPFARPAAVSATDLVYLIVFGGTQTGLAFLLLTKGSRLIPATETGLIGALETPLAPVWVWAAFGEVPTTAAMIGGTIVLGAVVGHVVAESHPAPAHRNDSGGDSARRESLEG